MPHIRRSSSHSDTSSICSFHPLAICKHVVSFLVAEDKQQYVAAILDVLIGATKNDKRLCSCCQRLVLRE